MAESARFTPGAQRPPVVDVAGVKVGVMTCYDLRFPEVGRALADAGAQLVAVPAAWFRGPFKEEHWTVLLRARAIEDTVYVAGAGQCGTRYVGRSMVVDPMGVVVSALGEDEGVAMAQIDVRRLGRVRAGNPVLKQRRFRVVADWEDRVAASAGASDPDAAADVVDSDVQVIATHR
jgi:predicted amidohydrolase